MDLAEFLAFRKFFTPIAIQVIFWLGVVAVIIACLANMFHSFAYFITGLVLMVLGIVMVRIYCELLILLFRIYDELVAMRTGRPPTDMGFPVTPITPMPTTPGAPVIPPTSTI